MLSASRLFRVLSSAAALAACLGCVTSHSNEALKPVAPATLVLRGGAAVTGDLLKERPDALVLDIGYTVLTVPREDIVRRADPAAPDAPTAPATPADRIYTVADPAALRERPVKELAREFCSSVAVVSTPAGLGSGFAVDDAGHFVTNAHVILGEQDVAVTLFTRGETALDRTKIVKVRIVAVNPYIDLALLKVDLPEGLTPRPIPLASSDSVQQGQNVFAIGNPLGLERTVSEGIISQTRRNFEGMIFLQTTAPVNPGNSGGPLLNLRGEVIGVINMKAGFFTEGLSFAIPVDVLRYFLHNRDTFAYDKDNPNSGFHYLPPPRRPVGAPSPAPVTGAH